MSITSSIRCRDSNPRPLDHESSLKTTKPGLPPFRWLVAAPIITNLANYHSQNKNTLFEPNACSEDVRNFLNGCLQNFSLKRLIKISQIPRR